MYFNDYLFNSKYLSDFYKERKQSIYNEINSFTLCDIDENNLNEMSEYLFNKYRLTNIVLALEDKKLDEKETYLNMSGDPGYLSTATEVPGKLYTIQVIFSRDANLLWCRPSSYSLNYIKANIRGNTLSFTLSYPNSRLNSEKIREDIDSKISSIMEYINCINKDVDNYNPEIEIFISASLNNRYSQLKRDNKILQEIGIPLVKNNNVPSIIPIKKKLIKPQLKMEDKTDSNSRYHIENEDYEHILSIIRHGAVIFEKAPATFNKLQEEDLRNVLLSHLNSHYQGMTTGETFSKNGKTDIHISFKGLYAFIAECKIWKGKQSLVNATDQLLSYATWRDNKNALIMFVKNESNFSSIQSHIENICTSHNKFIKTINSSKAEWRFLFQNNNDTEQKFLINIFLYNLYTDKN